MAVKHWLQWTEVCQRYLLTSLLLCVNLVSYAPLLGTQFLSFNPGHSTRTEGRNNLSQQF